MSVEIVDRRDIPLGRARPKVLFVRFLRKWLSSRLSALVLAALGATALLILGLPRAGAQAIILPVHDTLEALQEGRAISATDLERAAEALAAARRLDPGDARLASDLGLIELLEAEGAGLHSAEGRLRLEAAIGDLERALARSPANSFVWARLAGARLSREGRPGPMMLAALRLSYVTGPYVDKIMPFRAGLSLGAWDALDSTLRGYARAELVYLWERRGVWAVNQEPLIGLLCRTGRVGVLAAALIEAHRSLAEFDKLYPLYMTPEGCRTKFGA